MVKREQTEEIMLPDQTRYQESAKSCHLDVSESESGSYEKPSPLVTETANRRRHTSSAEVNGYVGEEQ